MQMRLLAPSIKRQVVMPFALPLAERKQEGGDLSFSDMFPLQLGLPLARAAFKGYSF